jgi:hypothetical protein
MSSSKQELFTSPVASGKKRRHEETFDEQSPAICRSAKKRKTLEQLGDLTVVTNRLDKEEKRMNKAMALKAYQKPFQTLLESTKKDQKKAGKDWATCKKSLRRYERKLSKANSDYEKSNFRDDEIDAEMKKLMDNHIANSHKNISVLREQCEKYMHKVIEVTKRLQKYLAIKEGKIEPQLHKYFNHYATISGKDLMEEEYGIPYCFEFGANLSGDIMMKLRKQMKYLGYPGAQKFRLSDLGTTKMWKEIAEAVGLRLPSQEDTFVAEVLKFLEEECMDDSDEEQDQEDKLVAEVLKYVEEECMDDSEEEQDDDESEGDKESEPPLPTVGGGPGGI